MRSSPRGRRRNACDTQGRASTSALFRDAAADAQERKRDEAALKTSLAFFQSPLFQRIQKAEEASETGLLAEVLAVFGQALEAQMRSANALLPANKDWPDQEIAAAVAFGRHRRGLPDGGKKGRFREVISSPFPR